MLPWKVRYTARGLMLYKSKPIDIHHNVSGTVSDSDEFLLYI